MKNEYFPNSSVNKYPIIIENKNYAMFLLKL